MISKSLPPGWSIQIHPRYKVLAVIDDQDNPVVWVDNHGLVNMRGLSLEHAFSAVLALISLNPIEKCSPWIVSETSQGTERQLASGVSHASLPSYRVDNNGQPTIITAVIDGQFPVDVVTKIYSSLNIPSTPSSSV